MTKPDKENWICNIQDYADRVAEQLGWELDKLLEMTLQAMAATEDLISQEMKEL